MYCITTVLEVIDSSGDKDEARPSVRVSTTSYRFMQNFHNSLG